MNCRNIENSKRFSINFAVRLESLITNLTIEVLNFHDIEEVLKLW